MPKHGACCLSSLNLSEFIKNPYTNKAYMDTDEFVQAVKIGIRTLDKLIDENYYRHPLKEQQEMSYNYRNIGLGCFGYATALMKLGLKYGSQEALDFTDQIFSLMFRAAVIESNELSKEFGPFPKYKDCVWDSDIIKIHFLQEEIDQMRQYGLRNCSLISIAPNGSTGTILSESTGCEPQFAMKFTRRTVGMTDGEDTYYDVYCKAAQDYMKINSTDTLPDYFVSAPEIPWQDRIMTQAIMQRHVDTAISSTVNLPNSATKDDIAKLYIMAWEQGLKGVTIFRDGCKRMPILSTKEKQGKQDKNALTQIETNNTLSRGFIIDTNDNLVGKKRKIISGCGSLHCVAFFDPDSGELMETYLSKGSQGGCNSFMVGLSRMISLAARAGVGIDSIIDQLKSSTACPSYAARHASKHDTSIGSCCPGAIAFALKDMWNEMQDEISDDSEEAEQTFIPEINSNRNTLFNNVDTLGAGEKCPECGGPIIHIGGCVQCSQCSWSKCD